MRKIPSQALKDNFFFFTKLLAFSCCSILLKSEIQYFNQSLALTLIPLMSLFHPRCSKTLALENHLLHACNQVAEQISQKWAEWCPYNKIHDLQPQKLPLLLIGTLPCFLSELICFLQTPTSSFPCPFLTEI